MPTLIRRKSERQYPTPKNNKEVYNSNRWKMFSRAFLKANPLCAECLKEGRTSRARASDHTIPIEEGGAIWDVANLTQLCFPHHNRKTARENKGRNVL